MDMLLEKPLSDTSTMSPVGWRIYLIDGFEGSIWDNADPTTENTVSKVPIPSDVRGGVWVGRTEA